MAYVLAVRHKVRNYAKWKSKFDSDLAMRKAGGEKSYRIFRTLDDPNNLMLLFQWDSTQNFQKYAQSDTLREAQRQAGLVGQPDIYLLEEIESGTV